jgi:hypothetical protein
LAQKFTVAADTIRLDITLLVDSIVQAAESQSLDKTVLAFARYSNEALEQRGSLYEFNTMTSDSLPNNLVLSELGDAHKEEIYSLSGSRKPVQFVKTLTFRNGRGDKTLNLPKGYSDDALPGALAHTFNNVNGMPFIDGVDSLAFTEGCDLGVVNSVYMERTGVAGVPNSHSVPAIGRGFSTSVPGQEELQKFADIGSLGDIKNSRRLKLIVEKDEPMDPRMNDYMDRWAEPLSSNIQNYA